MTMNIFYYRNGVVGTLTASTSKFVMLLQCCFMCNVFFSAYVHIWKPSLKIPAYTTDYNNS